jgi:hypothetical protein
LVPSAACTVYVVCRCSPARMMHGCCLCHCKIAPENTLLLRPLLQAVPTTHRMGSQPWAHTRPQRCHHQTPLQQQQNQQGQASASSSAHSPDKKLSARRHALMLGSAQASALHARHRQ